VRPVLIAVGPFASLRASQAAAAIARGLDSEGVPADLCAASDGGPGTLEALLLGLGGEARRGGYALVDDGAIAIAETQAALQAALGSEASAIVVAGAARDAQPSGDGRIRVPDARFVLDALDYDVRMRASRAVITGGATLGPGDLRGTLISEAATRARQSGVPCFAIAGRVGIDAFGQRMLDLEVVAQAASAKTIERAAQALAPHLPSS
jgi:glycerate 2-kinase